MSTFNLVIPQLLDAEGGYVNDPNDPGGETKYGISKRQYPNVDIPNLTPSEACEILERDFWNRYRIYEIKNQQIANKIFLAIINLGPYTASLAVQRTICICLHDIGLDGILGTESIAAINSAPYGWFLDRFRVELCLIYAKNHEKEVIPGLIKRACT